MASARCFQWSLPFTHSPDPCMTRCHFCRFNTCAYKEFRGRLGSQWLGLNPAPWLPRGVQEGCRPPAAAGLPSPRSPGSTLVLPLAYPRASLKPNYQEMAWAPASRVSAPAQESRSAGMRGWDLGQPAGDAGNRSKGVGVGQRLVAGLWILVRWCGDPQGSLSPLLSDSWTGPPTAKDR